MAGNRDNREAWPADIAESVEYYNKWFLAFAPETFRATRIETTGQVERALAHTANFAVLDGETLRRNPEILPILRMATCPPIARDRLIGLSGVPGELVRSMELDERMPPRLSARQGAKHLEAMIQTITTLLDADIVPWIGRPTGPEAGEVHRAAIVIADRLCGAMADPIIRNAQERRQLAAIGGWLRGRGYAQVAPTDVGPLAHMTPGTFAFRLNVTVSIGASGTGEVSIPIDVAAQPLAALPGSLPIMIEAKSAGDFTNVNKRRKEEATKIAQLRANFASGVTFVLFLCGYFDSGYLSYEAAEGIEWVWEHRIDDFAQFGL